MHISIATSHASSNIYIYILFYPCPIVYMIGPPSMHLCVQRYRCIYPLLKYALSISAHACSSIIAAASSNSLLWCYVSMFTSIVVNSVYDINAYRSSRCICSFLPLIICRTPFLLVAAWGSILRIEINGSTDAQVIHSDNGIIAVDYHYR